MTTTAISAAAAQSGSPLSQSTRIRTSNHLISIPHPHHPHHLVCILHLRDSLFVWLGEAPLGASDEPSRISASRDNDGGGQGHDGQESLALCEEDERQLALDRQMEEELSRALTEAGREAGLESSDGHVGKDEISRQSKGFLAREWGVAMYRQGSSISTSLFRTSSDLALPIARRLSRRLGIPQLHLSLSLPPGLLAEGNMPAPPGSNQAIMAIEMGLEEAIKEAMSDLQLVS